MNALTTSSVKTMLRRLAESNPLTRRLMDIRYERHVERIVMRHCKDCGTLATFRDDVVEIRESDRLMLIDRRNALHAPSLAKAFDVYFSAVQFSEENGLKVVDYSKPRVQTLKNGLQFEFSCWPEESQAIDGYVLPQTE